MSKKRQPEQRVEYLPPTDEAIYAFARSARKQLAENGNPTCATLEVVSGLTDFLSMKQRNTLDFLSFAHKHVK